MSGRSADMVWWAEWPTLPWPWMSGSRLPIRFYNDGTDKIAVAKQGNPQLTVADSTFVSGAVAFGGGVVISGILLAAAARQRLTLVDSL